MNKKIIVVGADYAGLTAAALIADKGFDVTLYEKRAESQLDNNTVETLNPDMLALTGIGLPPNDKWLSCDDPVIYCPSLSKEFHRTVPEKKRNIKIDSKDLFEHILAFAKEKILWKSKLPRAVRKARFTDQACTFFGQFPLRNLCEFCIKEITTDQFKNCIAKELQTFITAQFSQLFFICI